jgi:hypothetical protein
MKRPFLAVLLVALGLLAPVAGATAPAGAAAAPKLGAAAAPVATAPVTILPVAAKGDRCAPRSKTVNRLKKRYKAARTKNGRARSLRRLNAARRALKRCRARKPAPAPLPAPGTSPAPTPAPAPGDLPTTVPGPTTQPPAPPAPPGVTLTVNDGPGGTFASSTTFTIAVTGLPTPPEGTYYRLAIRSPLEGDRKDWRTCQQPADSDPFRATGAAVTLAPTRFPRWCVGAGRVFVWAGALEDGYQTNAPTIVALDINVVD